MSWRFVDFSFSFSKSKHELIFRLVDFYGDFLLSLENVGMSWLGISFAWFSPLCSCCFNLPVRVCVCVAGEGLPDQTTCTHTHSCTANYCFLSSSFTFACTPEPCTAQLHLCMNSSLTSRSQPAQRPSPIPAQFPSLLPVPLSQVLRFTITSLVTLG